MTYDLWPGKKGEYQTKMIFKYFHVILHSAVAYKVEDLPNTVITWGKSHANNKSASKKESPEKRFFFKEINSLNFKFTMESS